MLDIEKEYTISEVAEITNYPPYVLRYYEKEFELDIPRNKSNHRYYTFKEIELFQYIKSLQDKGFSNKQIKLIIKSPELIVNDLNSETAVTDLTLKQNTSIANISNEICSNIQELICNEIKPLLKENDEHSIELINELKQEVERLRNELNSKERDVLICENAKLKMKVKEKTYETVKLKEELKKEEEKSNTNFFKRLFSKNKKNH